jgi:cytochrome-b5 reductase
VVSRVNDSQDVKNVFSRLTIAMMISILIVAVTASTVYFAKTPQRAENLPVEHFLSAGVTATYGGFWKGFTTSTLLAIISAALGLQQLEKALDVQKNVHKYPAHKTTPFKIHSPKQHLGESVLHPQQYRKLPFVRKEVLSPDTYRFVFSLPKPIDILRLPTGQHVSIQAEIDGQMVSRSYTPVSNSKDQGYLEFVIKVYPQGVMTNYLAALKPNDLVHFRGPKGRMNYHRGLCKNLGMIVGGTGITPAYQIIRAICEDPEDNTRVSLLYANHTEEDILLRGELARFQYQFPSKLSVWHVLNSPPEKWQYGKGRVTRDIIRDKLAAPSSGSKVHLCGPHEMVVAMRKILVELGFEPPRAMSKTDDQIFLF